MWSCSKAVPSGPLGNRSGVVPRSADYLHSLIHRCDTRQVDFHAIYNALQLLEGTSVDAAIARQRKRWRNRGVKPDYSYT